VFLRFAPRSPYRLKYAVFPNFKQQLNNFYRWNMLSGKKLGRYKIQKKIGAGGMGEVYLAHDEQLDRNVALKVLLPEFCCDSERVQRFKSEAKAASSLNHPSIITIHEIGEQDDQLYIATEYVEGVTLREKIEKGELSLYDSIKIAEQVADALIIAHEEQIVHRDIKPENVMIRPDGIVKILDFGLAKPIFLSKSAGTEDQTIQLIKTQPGMVMGSVRYMSPEQARGKPTDERTDIWSLGVVLYEMLTGKNPFEGETVSDSLAALIHIEPKQIEDVPEELQRIIRKSLRKNASERYQSIKEFSLDLKDLRAHIEYNSAEHNVPRFAKTMPIARHDTSENATLIHRTISAEHLTSEQSSDWKKAESSASQTKRRFLRFFPIGLLAILAVTVLSSLYFFPNLFAGNAPKFDSIQVSRLTENGNAHSAAVSPDGKLVSFINIQNGRQSLIVRQVTTGSSVEVVPPTDEEILQPTFSPDGDHIFYVSGTSSIRRLFQVSTLGGESKRLINDIDSSVTFSPDGKKFAFLRHNPNEGGDTIFTANKDGTDLQQFVYTKEVGFDRFTGMDWSPDGETLLLGVYKSSIDSPKKMQIAAINLRDKQLAMLGGKNWQVAESFNWFKDGSGFLFLGKPSMSENLQIWRMNYPTGELKQITTDTSDYGSLSVAANTNSIVTTKVDTISSFWSVSPNSKEMKQLSGESKTLLAHLGISYSPNGKLYYAKKTGEEVNVFSMNEDGSDEKQLTSGARLNYEAVVTPDGKFVIFSSNRNGFFNLFRMDADGKNPIQLTSFQNGVDSQIDVMPDSKTVLFSRQSSDHGKVVLMKVSIEGGEAQTIFPEIQSSALLPRVSPDGKHLAFQTFHYDQEKAEFDSTLKIVPFGESQGDKTVKEIEFGLHFPIEWSNDGKSLTYINNSGVDNVWALSVENKTEKPLTAFNSGNITSFAWSGDGKKLFLVRGIYNSDLVLIKDGSKS
jgi:serine/threonine protein kinase